MTTENEMRLRNHPPSNVSFVHCRNRMRALQDDKKKKHFEIAENILKNFSSKRKPRHVHLSAVQFDRTATRKLPFDMPFVSTEKRHLSWNASIKVAAPQSSVSSVESVKLESLWQNYTTDISYANPDNVISLLSNLIAKSDALKNTFGTTPRFVQSPTEYTDKIRFHHRKIYINSQLAGSPVDFSFDKKRMKIFYAQFKAHPSNMLYGTKCFIYVGPVYPSTAFGDSDCHMNLAFGCVIRAILSSMEDNGDDSFASKISASNALSTAMAASTMIDLASYQFVNIMESILIPTNIVACHVDWGYPFLHRINDRTEWTKKFAPSSESWTTGVHKRLYVCAEAAKRYDEISENVKHVMSDFLCKNHYETREISDFLRGICKTYFYHLAPFQTRYIEHRFLGRQGVANISQLMYHNYMIPFMLNSIRINMQIQLLKNICFSRIAQILSLALPTSQKPDQHIGETLWGQDELSDDDINIIIETVQTGTRKHDFNILSDLQSSIDGLHEKLAKLLDCPKKNKTSHSKINFINDTISAVLHVQYGLHAFGYGMSKFASHEEEIHTLHKLIKLYYICFDGMNNISNQVPSKKHYTPQSFANELSLIFKAADDALNLYTTLDNGTMSETHFTEDKNDSTRGLLLNLHHMQPEKAFREGKIHASEIVSSENVKPAIIHQVKVPINLDTTRIHCSLHELNKLNELACKLVKAYLPCTSNTYPTFTDAATKISPIFGEMQLKQMERDLNIDNPCWVVCDFDCDTRNLQFKIMHYHDKNPHQERGYDNFQNASQIRPYIRPGFDAGRFNRSFIDPGNGTDEDNGIMNNIVTSLKANADIIPDSQITQGKWHGNKTCIVHQSDGIFGMAELGSKTITVWVGGSSTQELTSVSCVPKKANCIASVVATLKYIYHNASKKQVYHNVVDLPTIDQQSDGKETYDILKEYWEDMQSKYSVFRVGFDESNRRVYIQYKDWNLRILQVMAYHHVKLTIQRQINFVKQLIMPDANDPEFSKAYGDWINQYLAVDIYALTEDEMNAIVNATVVVTPAVKLRKLGDYIVFQVSDHGTGTPRDVKVACPDGDTQQARQDFANAYCSAVAGKMDQQQMLNIFLKIMEDRKAMETYLLRYPYTLLQVTSETRQLKMWLSYNRMHQSQLNVSLRESASVDFNSVEADKTKIALTFHQPTESQIVKLLDEVFKTKLNWGMIATAYKDAVMADSDDQVTSSQDSAIQQTPPLTLPPTPGGTQPAENVETIPERQEKLFIDQYFQERVNVNSAHEYIVNADQPDDIGSFLKSNNFQSALAISAQSAFVTFNRTQPNYPVLVCLQANDGIQVFIYVAFCDYQKNIRWINLLPSGTKLHQSARSGSLNLELEIAAMTKQLNGFVSNLVYGQWTSVQGNAALPKTALWTNLKINTIKTAALAKKIDITSSGSEITIRFSDQNFYTATLSKRGDSFEICGSDGIVLATIHTYANKESHNPVAWEFSKYVLWKYTGVMDDRSIFPSIIDYCRGASSSSGEEDSSVKRTKVESEQITADKIVATLMDDLRAALVAQAGSLLDIAVSKTPTSAIVICVHDKSNREAIPMYTTTLYADSAAFYLVGSLFPVGTTQPIVMQPTGYYNAQPLATFIVSNFKGQSASASQVFDPDTFFSNVFLPNIQEVLNNAVMTAFGSKAPLPSSGTWSLQGDVMVQYAQPTREQPDYTVTIRLNGYEQTVIIYPQHIETGLSRVSEVVTSALLQAQNWLWLQQQASSLSIAVQTIVNFVLKPLAGAIISEFRDHEPRFLLQVVENETASYIVAKGRFTTGLLSGFNYGISNAQPYNIMFTGKYLEQPSRQTDLRDLNAGIIRVLSTNVPESSFFRQAFGALRNYMFEYVNAILMETAIPNRTNGDPSQMAPITLSLDLIFKGFFTPFESNIRQILSNEPNFEIFLQTMSDGNPRLTITQKLSTDDVYQWEVWADATAMTVSMSQPQLGREISTAAYTANLDTAYTLSAVFCTLLPIYQSYFKDRVKNDSAPKEFNVEIIGQQIEAAKASMVQGS